MSVPVLSIVEETVRALQGQASHARIAGLMASTAVAHTQLYAQPLEAAGMATVVPDECSQRALMESLYAIKSGDKGTAVKAQLLKVANELQADGAQAVLLACTEIPLVLEPGDSSVPVPDTLEVLARAAVRESRGNS